MSFAEFSYPLMQAWDWWVLFRKGVQVQVGGTDQYGNILFGMDAVKSISRNTADEQERNALEKDVDRPIGLTTPLLTASSGEKLGKSAGNAVWLDKDMTSTFELYQVCSTPRAFSIKPAVADMATSSSFEFPITSLNAI
jgi:tyrosyl-tRNA synthetase